MFRPPLCWTHFALNFLPYSKASLKWRGNPESFIFVEWLNSAWWQALDTVQHFLSQAGHTFATSTSGDRSRIGLDLDPQTRASREESRPCPTRLARRRRRWGWTGKRPGPPLSSHCFSSPDLFRHWSNRWGRWTIYPVITNSLLSCCHFYTSSESF